MNDYHGIVNKKRMIRLHQVLETYDTVLCSVAELLIMAKWLLHSIDRNNITTQTMLHSHYLKIIRTAHIKYEALLQFSIYIYERERERERERDFII